MGSKWKEVMWQWIAADVRIWEDAGLRTDKSCYEFMMNNKNISRNKNYLAGPK